MSSAKNDSNVQNEGTDEVKSARWQAAQEKLERAAKGSSGSGGTDFIATPSGTSVHASQSEMVKSITDAGATRVGPNRTSEVGEIYRMDTPNGPIEIRVMEGKQGGGLYSGRRTIVTREGTGSASGTGEYVHPNGARIQGAVSKNERKGIGHIHGQTP